MKNIKDGEPLDPFSFEVARQRISQHLDEIVEPLYNESLLAAKNQDIESSFNSIFNSSNNMVTDKTAAKTVQTRYKFFLEMENNQKMMASVLATYQSRDNLNPEEVEALKELKNNYQNAEKLLEMESENFKSLPEKFKPKRFKKS